MKKNVFEKADVFKKKKLKIKSENITNKIKKLCEMIAKCEEM